MTSRLNPFRPGWFGRGGHRNGVNGHREPVADAGPAVVAAPTRPPSYRQRIKEVMSAEDVVAAVAQEAQADLLPVIHSCWEGAFNPKVIHRRLLLRTAIMPMKWRNPWVWALLSLPVFTLLAMMFPGISATELPVRITVGVLLGPVGSYVVWCWRAFLAVYAPLKVFAHQDWTRPEFVTHRITTVAPRCAYLNRPEVFFGTGSRSGVHNGSIRLKLPRHLPATSVTSLAKLYLPDIMAGRSTCTENVATERATLKGLAKEHGAMKFEKKQTKGWRRMVRDNALGIFGAIGMLLAFFIIASIGQTAAEQAAAEANPATPVVTPAPELTPAPTPLVIYETEPTESTR